jgi:hypothetical protein
MSMKIIAIAIAIAATAAVGVIACSHPTPPASTKTVTITALPPSTTTPPLPHSQLLRLTLPAGSTVSADAGIEVWWVPIEPVDEIADVRAQLPINQPYDGLPWCAEDQILTNGEGMQWSWGTK